ncbi:MAG: MobA/MobL family protein [Acidobacteriaceae bacterium]
MALYRFSTIHVSRGKGDGAIKRAAYNGRCELSDERTGQAWNYSGRSGLEASDIFVPDGAPKWMRDRQALWNEAAAAEDLSRRRDTAREARDFKISLPHELNAQQREWLVKDFARYLVRKGMVVDWAIHAPDDHSDSRHYHAHLLTTTREITREGFGNKVREWDKRETLQEWRERFAEMGAKQLERAGFKLEAERYREAFGTLQEQRRKAIQRGDMEHAERLDREPTRPMGPKAAAMERDPKRRIRTVRGNQNREIVARNEQRSQTREKARTGGVARDGRKAGGRAGKALGGLGTGVLGIMDALVASGPKTPEEKERDRLLREKRDRQAERQHKERERDR